MKLFFVGLALVSLSFPEIRAIDELEYEVGNSSAIVIKKGT
ncbi:GNAT family N-acetyltransferase [Candidatus Bealeia paramacronuclearis]|nr:GNAT family N-acetyltransferase [Candidatus Bealeia paramacronuclearis]